jgi:hypothetical protein
MSEALSTNFEQYDGPPDYKQKIIDFLTETDVQLPEHTIDIMVQGLNEAYQKYGLWEGNETANEYHNDEHHYEVFTRFVIWMKRFEKYFSITFKTEDYEVGAIASTWHDNIVRQGDPNGITDEMLSANAAIEAMTNSPKKYGARIKRRVDRAIDATTVEYRDGGVFQMKVMIGKPDYAVVAVALGVSAAVLTESEEKIIGDVSKLATELIPVGSTDITLTTDAVMKIIGSEEKFINQRLEDLQKYLLFLNGNPEKVQNIVDIHFYKRRKQLLGFTALIDNRLSEVRQNVTDSLNDSKETTERIVSKIHNGIMRGLYWSKPSE